MQQLARRLPAVYDDRVALPPRDHLEDLAVGLHHVLHGAVQPVPIGERALRGGRGHQEALVLQKDLVGHLAHAPAHRRSQGSESEVHAQLLSEGVHVALHTLHEPLASEVRSPSGEGPPHLVQLFLLLLCDVRLRGPRLLLWPLRSAVAARPTSAWLWVRAGRRSTRQGLQRQRSVFGWCRGCAVLLALRRRRVGAGRCPRPGLERLRRGLGRHRGRAIILGLHRLLLLLELVLLLGLVPADAEASQRSALHQDIGLLGAYGGQRHSLSWGALAADGREAAGR
mmetsp:Transcript_81740/g.226404  ORF Transcript_81740/g.226404 Transcript_81740/m.226404 type:complete len:283 (+) Transcript_81740:229-1077(+)